MGLRVFLLKIFPSVSDSSISMSYRSMDHMLAHLYVIVCHASGRETLLGNFSATCPTKVTNPEKCFRRILELAHYKTCYSIRLKKQQSSYAIPRQKSHTQISENTKRACDVYLTAN